MWNFRIKVFNILFITFIWLQIDALIIDCHFVYKDWIHTNKDTKEVASLLYGCNAKILMYGINNDTVTEVIESHMKGSTNKNVKLLNIDRQPYNKIPKGITKFFQNLVGLFVQDSKLQSVSNKDLRPFPKLQYLSLYGNLIESIENDLFKFTPNIVYVNFGWNLLMHVGTGILKPLKKLSTVSFYRNTCISSEVWKGTAKTIESLSKELKRKCKPTSRMQDREEQRSKPHVRSLADICDDIDDEMPTNNPTSKKVNLIDCYQDNHLQAEINAWNPLTDLRVKA